MPEYLRHDFSGKCKAHRRTIVTVASGGLVPGLKIDGAAAVQIDPALAPGQHTDWET